MKAFLLAAGKGTRLRPITYTTPKCLVPIRGRPLLDYWFDLLKLHGVDEVLINLHHLADKVEEYLRRRESHDSSIRIHRAYERKLLGSAGTILENRDFVSGEESFLILYADNLTDINLTDFISFHGNHSMPVTLALFRAPNPSQCGIAELDGNGVIIGFEEKPPNPKGNLASAGIYAARQEIFDFIPRGEADLARDVLTKLVGRMCGYIMKEHLIDVGTIENYRKAQEIEFLKNMSH